MTGFIFTRVTASVSPTIVKHFPIVLPRPAQITHSNFLFCRKKQSLAEKMCQDCLLLTTQGDISRESEKGVPRTLVPISH